MIFRQILALGLGTALMHSQLQAEDVDFSAATGVEARIFTEEATQNQDDFSGSFYVEPEWYYDGESARFTFKPFLRLDSMDSERTHADIREAYWLMVGDEWSLNIGINKVFWGVAETQHLVDIINQTDQVENIDGEDKLGQPMINYNWEKDWGTLSLFVLPGFRERTFAGEDGRLRFEIPVDADAATYESSAEQYHTDVALRFSKVIGLWDIGIAHFIGTSREPVFNVNPVSGYLEPYYPQINQSSIDAQATLEDWLLKLEMIYRTGFGFDGSEKDYLAAVMGFEYSTYGVFDSVIDLGWILEYQYDERDQFGNQFFNIELSDVVVLGARFTFNDPESSDLLLGLGAETDNDAQFISIEGSRRIGNDMRLSVEGRLFAGIDDTQPSATFFYSYRNDDFIQITLDKYF